MPKGPGFHRPFPHSLRGKILLLVLLAFAPAVVIHLAAGWENRRAAIEDAQQRTIALARRAAQDHEELIYRTTPPLLRTLAALYPEVRAQEGTKVSALFARVLPEYPQYFNILAARAPSGEVFASGMPLDRPLSLADRPYFHRLLRTRGYVISRFAIAKLRGRPTLVCAGPVFDDQGKIRAVIGVGINLERLANQLARSQPQKALGITLFDRAGVVLLSTSLPKSWVGRDASRSALWRAIQARQGEGVYQGPGVGGAQELVAFEPLSGEEGRTDAYVAASVPEKAALARADRLLWRSLIGAAVSTGIVLLGLLFIGRRAILRGIDSLIGTADRLAAGDLDARTGDVGETEEFQRLARAFDGMAESLLQRQEAQRAAERALFEEKEQLAVTLRSIGDGVIATDLDARVTIINKVAQDLTGWTAREALGRPLGEVFSIVNADTREPCASPAEKVLTTGEVQGLANHTMLLGRDGREYVIADSGSPIRDRESRIIGVVLAFRDVTSEERQEEERARTQQLESLAVLAGGIAHDFNNLLTGILGNVSLALTQVRPGDALHSRLAAAEAASLRAKKLTEQLLTFSKGGAPIKKIADLGVPLQEAAGFASHGTAAASRFEIPADLWLAEVDEGQIGQVIQNLTINAAQAMPAGGTVTYRAENLVLDPENPYGLDSGSYVKLSVQDQGVGIPPNILPRIFDPYFTTKPKGSGLGLAVCHSVVEQHGGRVTASSRLGEGTTFEVLLPACPGKTLPQNEAPQAPLLSCSGRILVMDDEEIIRDLAVRLLETLGYKAESARDGEEALALCRQARQAGSPFAAVIADLTVPGGMGGKELAEHLREFDPTMRLIVSSGYANDTILANFQQHGFQAVLRKPYRISEMQGVLRSVIQPESA